MEKGNIKNFNIKINNDYIIMSAVIIGLVMVLCNDALMDSIDKQTEKQAQLMEQLIEEISNQKQ